MEIQKIFSDEYNEECFYSVLMSEEEMYLFSKLQDDDYYEEQNERKRSVRHAKGAGTIAGGLLGASVGASFPRSGKGKLIGAAIGATGGGVLGRAAGKAVKKSTEEDAERNIKRYKNSNEKDRKYLREKNEREKDRELQERQARAMENVAWHTSRWYSEKEDYLNGKETDFQKKSRKAQTISIAGLGTTIGAGAGVVSATTNPKNFLRAQKISERALEDNQKVLKFVDRITNTLKKKGNRFKDMEAKEGFENALKWSGDRIKGNNKKIEKAYKLAEAMDNRAMVKRGVKGALIGTAAIAPLAYASNRYKKNRNEKINKSRRDKNKN